MEKMKLYILKAKLKRKGIINYRSKRKLYIIK